MEKKISINITNLMTTVQRAAWNDCEAGYFDKWYRYNHKDGGAAYENAWLEANQVYNNDTIHFIECSEINL